jgi:hypothetical protein
MHLVDRQRRAQLVAGRHSDDGSTGGGRAQTIEAVDGRISAWKP